jgi:hypothetical protein
VKKEVPQSVLVATISVVVVAVIVMAWFVLRPAPAERVPPRSPNMTRTSLLQQRLGQAPPAGSGGNGQ